MKLRHLRWTLAIGSILLASGLGGARLLRADSSMIEVVPARVATGAQASYGDCPCFRWSVRLDTGGGHVETRDFLISTDALFQYRETINPAWMRFAARTMRFGAIEALWKGAHLGLGFNGVTIGEDRDRGYSDILRTGLYALVNLIRADAATLDIRSGYDYEQMRVNLGPLLRRDVVSESTVFRWHGGAWSGTVDAHVSMDLDHGPHDASNLEYGGGASVRTRVLTLSDLQLGLSFAVSADHDPFRDLVGLADDDVKAGLYMDLSWVERP